MIFVTQMGNFNLFYLVYDFYELDEFKEIYTDYDKKIYFNPNIETRNAGRRCSKITELVEYRQFELWIQQGFSKRGA